MFVSRTPAPAVVLAAVGLCLLALSGCADDLLIPLVEKPTAPTEPTTAGPAAPQTPTTPPSSPDMPTPPTPPTDTPDAPDDAPGAIEGNLCQPDGSGPIVAAAIDVPGTGRSTRSDDDGHFFIADVPAGTWDLSIRAGAFTSTITVVVQAGTTTTLPHDACHLDLGGTRVAVVPGHSDDIEARVLAAGVPPAAITRFENSWREATWVYELGRNPRRLADFDILFIACGANVDFFVELGGSEPAVAPIRAWVEAGGTLVVTDHAYAVVEAIWPDAIDFVGDDRLFVARQGVSAWSPTATVTSPALAASLGTDELPLWFSTERWTGLEDVADTVDVLVVADSALLSLPTVPEGTVLPSRPQLVSFAAGRGRVMLSTFHADDQSESATQQVLRSVLFVAADAP